MAQLETSDLFLFAVFIYLLCGCSIKLHVALQNVALQIVKACVEEIDVGVWYAKLSEGHRHVKLVVQPSLETSRAFKSICACIACVGNTKNTMGQLRHLVRIVL